MERVYTRNAVDKATELNAELMGSGRGSLYNVSVEICLPALRSTIFMCCSHLLLPGYPSSKTCLGDSKTLKKLTSVNLADKPATDLKYNFYSIHNPKEYLGGSDAIVVEQGPYNLRCVLRLFLSRAAVQDRV